MVCECKSGCDTLRCSCKKRGEHCVRCLCIDCKNQPPPKQKPSKSAASKDAVVLQDDGATSKTVAVPQSPPTAVAGSASQVALHQTFGEQIRTGVTRHIYDEKGNLRETVMGWTDHRKATDTTVVAVHRDLAVFPTDVARRLQDDPAVVAQASKGLPVLRSVSAAFVEQWLRKYAEDPAGLQWFYAPNAVLEVSVAAVSAKDVVTGSANIAAVFQAYKQLFALEQQPELHEAMQPDQTFVIQLPQGTLSTSQALWAATAAPPDVTPNVLRQLWTALQQTGGATAFAFRRTLVCSAASIDGQLLPILLDRIELL